MRRLASARSVVALIGAACLLAVALTGSAGARTTTFEPYDQLVLNDGASHVWRLDELAGSTADDSVGSLDISGTAPAWIVDGPGPVLTGAGFHAPQSLSVIGTLSDFPVNNFSAESWFLTDGASCFTTVQQVMGLGNFMRSGAQGWGVWLDGSTCGPQTLKLTASLADIVVGPVVTAGVWHHLVVTRSGGSWSLFLDGVLVGSSATGNANAQSRFWIAHDFAGSAFHLAGALSRVAFYPAVLSSSEVLEHYEVGAGLGAGPPVEQTYGVFCEPGSRGSLAQAPCGTLSDPVNTLTGAFVHSETDVSLASQGVPIELTRTYTSADAGSGRFGLGWKDSFGAALSIQGNGDVVATGDEGQRLTFISLGGGVFEGAAGARASLVTIAGGFRMTTTDQIVYEFDTVGRLVSKKDRNTNGFSLAYDGNGRLATVTDDTANTATFSYNASNLVSGVALSDGRATGYGYTSGRLTSFTDVRGKSWSYTYDSGGRLATIVDPLSHTQVTNVYDGTSGRVVSQTDATNKTTLFAWDAGTQTATVTDPNSHVWKDVYADNVLLKRIDGATNATEFTHDGDLNATGVKSPLNETTSMTFDLEGNMLTATAPSSLGGAQKVFTYNASNDPLTVTDARGKVTAYTYTGGLVSTVTQDGQQVGSYTYDAQGRVETSTDGNGKTTDYTYDANGNTASVTAPDPDGGGSLPRPKTTFTYDSQGNVLTRVDPRGNVAGCGCASQYTTTSTYNLAGQLLTETDPLGRVTTTNVYDDAGRLTSTTDANSHTTSFIYDNANRVLTETRPDPDGAGPLLAPVTTSTYDDAGNRLTQTDPRGNTTTFAYDNANRLLSTTGPDPDGAGALTAPVSTNTYDVNGNLASTVEPRGNVSGANPNDYRTSFTYDAAGRLLTTTTPDPDGAGSQTASTTTNVYDAVGNLQSVTDGNGHTTSYTYDYAGRIFTVTAPDPDGAGALAAPVTAYTYDPVGNRLTRTDANSHVTTWVYDALNRVSTVTAPDPDGGGALTPSVTSYAFDVNGNQVSVTDAIGNNTGTVGDGTTTSAYDRANRLTGIDYSDATPDVTFTLDNVGNRLSMVDGSGTETRSYDNLDRLLTVTRSGTSFTYFYDAAGNVTRRTYKDDTVVDITYDPLNRMATVASGGRTTGYAYDPASNLTTTTLPATNGYVETRVYDRAGRLNQVKNMKGATTLADITYSRDKVGNPLTETRTGASPVSKTFQYDNMDRLTGVCYLATLCPGATDPYIRHTYDGVGNRLTEARPSTATKNYTYDNMDRLLTAGATSYTWDRNGNQLSAGTRTFTWDLANRMKTTTASGTTTTYSYDGDGVRLQASTGTAASAKTNFQWDVNNSLPMLAREANGSDSLLRRYVYGQRLIFMSTTSSNAWYYHYDPLGSVRNVTGSTGATQLTYDYEPYGAIRSSSGSTPTNLLKFTGEYNDPTGLYHLRARQNDTTLGRLASADPVQRADGLPAISSFAYADLQPVVKSDPSGEIARSMRSSSSVATAFAEEATTDLEELGVVESQAVEERTRAAFKFFIRKGRGLRGIQSAGVVGNLLVETGYTLNPRTNQDGGGPGRGLAQWSADGRWLDLLGWAETERRPPYGFYTQLRFIWYELNHGFQGALRHLRAARTVTAATIVFQDEFEKPSVPHQSDRIREAKRVFRLYG